MAALAGALPSVERFKNICFILYIYCFMSSVLNYFCFISLKTQGDLEET